MKRLIEIKVIPNAKKNDIQTFGDGFKVRLTAPPTDNKANDALIDLLADHFNVKRSQVEIVKGRNSRVKIISLFDAH